MLTKHALLIFSVIAATIGSATADQKPGANGNAGVAAVEQQSPSMAEDYCANISDKAADARVAWQTANLQKLETDITAKLTELDTKQKELQDWIAKRDQMLKAAGRELVDIYAKMDPEAVSIQLAEIDIGTATSILRQLTPRSAGAILNLMEPERAAALVKDIAAATSDAPPGGGT